MAKKQKIAETVQINDTNIQEVTVENLQTEDTNTQEVTVENVQPVEAAAENVQPVEAAAAEEKKKRNAFTREDVKARRAQVAGAIFQAIANAAKPLSRADISRAADDILGRQGDSTSWVDGGVALASFIKDGLVEETKAEGKKKTLYRLVAPAEAQASEALPADETPAE